jgi:putative transposase
MKVRYHQSALREGRFSERGSVYSIVKNVEDLSRRLIRDPFNPQTSEDTVRILTDSFKWHHVNGYLICLGYTVLPDHYHLVFLLAKDRSLDEVMGGIGGFSAKGINRLNGWAGQFWQTGYRDRMVRDDEELENQMEYVWQNPAKAGFVNAPEDWPFTDIHPDWESPWV